MDIVGHVPDGVMMLSPLTGCVAPLPQNAVTAAAATVSAAPDTSTLALPAYAYAMRRRNRSTPDTKRSVCVRVPSGASVSETARKNQIASISAGTPALRV